MKSVPARIAARLSAARKVHHDSARSFAIVNNLPVTTYSQHETGKRALSVSGLLEYSGWLKVNPSWLLTGKGLPYPNDEQAIEWQAQLYNFLDERDQGELYDIEQAFLIKGEVAEIDVGLLKVVLEKIVGISGLTTVTGQDLIEFSFDTYNSVVQTSASFEDKVLMIDLSIQSLVRGVKARGEGAEKVSEKRA